jgi:hypothetical protein
MLQTIQRSVNDENKEDDEVPPVSILICVGVFELQISGIMHSHSSKQLSALKQILSLYFYSGHTFVPVCSTIY